MSANTYLSQIQKNSNTQLTLRTQGYYPSAIILPINEVDTLTNTLSGNAYNVPSNDPTYPFPSLLNAGTKTFPLTSMTIFSEPTLPDGVYHLSLFATDVISGDTYASNAYQIFTYIIDDNWTHFQAVYNPNDPANLAIYNSITASYATIASLQGNLAANYAAINAEIENIQIQLASAIIYFDSTLANVSDSIISVSTDYEDSLFVGYSSSMVLTNETSQDDKTYTITLDITTTGTKTQNVSAGSPLGSPNFNDGYYDGVVNLLDVSGITFRSNTTKILVTTAIDAGIASYPQTTIFEIANKMAMQQLRTDLDTAFTAEDYTQVNYLFSQINYLLTTSGATDNSSTLSLEDRNTLEFVIVPQATTPISQQYDAIYNTIDTSATDSTFFTRTFAIPSGGGSTQVDSSVVTEAYYLDGVWAYYLYMLGTDSFYAEPFATTAYAVVTTTITNQFATFEANYDPNNAAQAASYQTMLTAFAQIATLSSDVATNYAAINTQIQLIQSELALFVDLGLTLELTSSNTLKTTITSTIPNVTYSDQSFVLTNLETLIEYSTNDFPANYVDTIKNITSTTFNNSTTYADSVYQVEVSWTSANDMEFAGNAYALVTTAIDCGIAKYGANNVIRKCNSASLKKATELLMYRKFITLEFAQGNYEMCIEYIKRIQTMLADCGCNC